MKYKINESDFNSLSESLQSEYEKDDSGDYILKIEGGEDTGALKRAKDHEKARRQKAEDKLKELESELSTAQADYKSLLDEKSDSAGLEKKWKEKLDAKEAEFNSQIQGLNGEMEKLLIDNVAEQMASDLSDSPSLLRPHIKGRLKVEKVDGKSTTRVLDENGEVSPLTLEELKSEFKSNPDFAPAIRGSNASGSGARGGNGGGGGDVKKPDFSTASPKEMAAYLKSKKEGGQ